MPGSVLVNCMVHAELFSILGQDTFLFFVLFCFVLFCFLFCFVLFCFVLFCFVCLFVCLFGCLFVLFCLFVF